MIEADSLGNEGSALGDDARTARSRPPADQEIDTA
jgi:hypothetical protein